MGVDQSRLGATIHEYEQATRELAPAALLVALYAGGKGVRSLSEARGAAGARWEGARLRERLGENGLGQLARFLQVRREAAVVVGVGGERAAMALYEARGNVARAQA